MTDVLVIEVLLPLGRYPTKDNNKRDGFRGGRKSPEFHLLTEAVIEAAQAEMQRIGWVKAEWYCETTVTRYHPTRREPDAQNCGATECDALTKAGVWVDDKLAKPFHAHAEWDPSGPDRVCITIRRRFPNVIPVEYTVSATILRRVVTQKPVERFVITQRKDGVTVGALPANRSGTVALLNGKPIPMDEAMKLVKGSR